ncbi:hypothetical protein [Sphingomonas melonis]|uniref:hypothetical protein n=1 Tax=Sphingomonas melonis TaxID=152682 RepID=UPI0035C85E6F
MSDNTPIHVVCPVCASPDVVVDATASWSFENQQWELSSTFDDRTCQTCSYEGHSFDEVTDADLTPEQRGFIYDGEDYPVPAGVKVFG